MLFFLQYSSIFPPEENAISEQSSSLADSKIVSGSTEFPEMLVTITRVFLSTVWVQQKQYD